MDAREQFSHVILSGLRDRSRRAWYIRNGCWYWRTNRKLYRNH